MDERPPQQESGPTPGNDGADAGGSGEEGGRPRRPRRRRDRGRGKRRKEQPTSVVPVVAAPVLPVPTRAREEKRSRRRERTGARGKAKPAESRRAAVSGDTAPPSPVAPRVAPTVRASADRSHRHASAAWSPGTPFWVAVGIITVIGLLVRLPGLNGGLWTDEIYSIMLAFRTPFPETLSVFPGDNKHPLYSLIAHASLSAFGESPWSVRLPAVLFGVGTIPMLYALGKRIASRAEALAAAALLALSYHHVWFSQNARGYSALAFFAVVATWLLVQALRADGYRLWIWYGVVAALGAYTHLTFVFTVVAQFLVVALAVVGWPKKERRIGWRAPLVGFGLSAVLALLLYLPMFSDVAAFFLHKQSNLRGISSPSWALSEGLRVLRLGFGGAFGIGLIVVGLAAIVGLAGAVSYARQSLRTFLLLALPALTTLMGAFTARGTMYPRFFFVLAGFALLIAIRGAFVTGMWLALRLRRGETAGHWWGAALAGGMVLVSAASVPLNYRAPKQDFEGAAQFAERSATGEDAIVTADVTTSVYSTYYNKPWRAIRSMAELDALRRGDAASGVSGKRVWFVYAFPRYLERFNAELAAYIQRECVSSNVQRFPGTVGDGDLLVCRLERT